MQEQIFNKDKYLHELEERIETIKNYYENRIGDVEETNEFYMNQNGNEQQQDVKMREQFFIKNYSENPHQSIFSEESTQGNNLSIILEDNGEDATCIDRSITEISKKTHEKDQLELRTSSTSKSYEIKNALSKSQ